MVHVNAVFSYLVAVGILLLVFKIIRVGMITGISKLKGYCSLKQLTYLNNMQLKNLIKSIKRELFLLNILYKFIPYFPYKKEKEYTDKEINYYIDGNVEYYKFYLFKFLPNNILNILIVLYILKSFYEISVYQIIVNNIRNITLPTFTELKLWISLASPLLVILIIVLAFYFLSPSGLIRTTKKAVYKDNLKKKIEFHFKHRLLFNRALRTGNKNMWYIIKNRKEFIENKTYKKAIYLEKLHTIDEIPLLAKAIKNFQIENCDLTLFIFGIRHNVCYDLEHKFFNLKDENEISKILQRILVTKEFLDAFDYSKNTEVTHIQFSNAILNESIS